MWLHAQANQSVVINTVDFFFPITTSYKIKYSHHSGAKQLPSVFETPHYTHTKYIFFLVW